MAAIASWQFYMFATFRDGHGALDLEGGTLHLWIAIGIAILVCVGGFFLFSRLLRDDNRDQMHITSQGHPLGVGRTRRNLS